MSVTILGIVNITADSFSDGGRFLDPSAALEQARKLAGDGADILDLGAAASNPGAAKVPADQEIARLDPVVAALTGEGRAISIDSFSPQVQRWAISRNVAYLNDIQGFPHAEIYPELASARAGLIVMHSVQGLGRAEKIDVPPQEIMDRIKRFFEARIAALTKAGIASNRLILDPGMGFFVGTNPQTSLTVLRRLGELKRAFGRPVLVSVSRKSFLRTVTGRPPDKAGAASLSAELFAAAQGADYIRTHDPGALKDGLAVQDSLAAARPGA